MTPGVASSGGLDELAAGAGPLHEELAWLVHLLEWVSVTIDMLAIVIALVGVVRFLRGFLGAEMLRDRALRLRAIALERMELGRYILASLEVVIVSDIIHIATTLETGDLVFLGLLVVPRAFKGRYQGAVALAIPLVWVLLGTAEGSTLSKTLDWCLYSVLGVLYAVWARALILAMLGWRAGPQSTRQAPRP